MVRGQGNATARYHFAIEDIAARQVVLRRTTTKEQLQREDIILAPSTRYRQWIYWVEGNLIGFTEFTTPGSGERFTIPKVSLGKTRTLDSDGDGLADEVEWVVGTNPLSADTDGDGINDGAAVRLGIDFRSSRTGIIGTSDTPGTAVDVCAVNNIVVVADSANGVSVFNVFNRMDPLIIAQVDTPGDSRAVASSGNYVVVADGAAGITVLDISNPPVVPILYQGSINGTAQAVAISGDLAFVGTVEGTLTMIELSTLTSLQALNLGGRIEDLAIEGSTLYAYANGKLQVLPIGQGPLAVSGSVNSPAPDGLFGRGRMFVGGGVAYLVHQRGYNAFSVTNATAPVMLLSNITPAFGWGHMALDGSGLMVAAQGPTSAPNSAHNLLRYRLTNGAVAAVFETEYATPGVSQALALYNGIAYLADASAGLQVIRFKETDFLGQRPSGTLSMNITNASSGIAIEGSRIFFSASVADDVQIRNVEFYVDGVLAATDGNYPFDFGWRAPVGTVGTIYTISATVSDTGGNRTDLNPLQIVTTEDTEPPHLVVESIVGAFEGDNLIIRLTAKDNVGIESLVFIVDGAVVRVKRISLTDWLVLSPLTPGSHLVTVRARDNSGLETTSTIGTRVLREAISREISVFNWFAQPEGQEAVSREVSVFNWFAQPEGQEAVSREVSVFNWFAQPEGQEAVSREVSVFNWFAQPEGQEAVSREVSVFNWFAQPEGKEAISREITVQQTTTP